jgi:GH43 family beta-xylosidase
MKKLLILSCLFVLATIQLHAQCTFTNPIKTGAADPQITYIDGYYYFLFTTGDGVWLRRHQNMQEVGNDAINGAKKIWGWNSEIVGHVWAPEIHKINGKFYIHASGSVTGNSNPESMRMFVLEANTTDPFGTYTYKGLLSNNYAIDQSIWQDPSNGSIYMSYSQWDNNIPGANPASLIQCTYICKMNSPTQMGTGVRLSYPATAWEKHKWWVNEGQYFLKKGNKLHIVFSVSGCAAAEYSLAMLTCSNGDYLNPSAWTKSSAPVFTQDPSKSVYGTGHHSTLETPNGEWWLVYHAVSDPAGSCGGIRSTRMQPFTFDANDNPVFGTPVATGVALSCPGSSNPPNYWNFTSTLEGWNTPMNLTANASNSIATLTVTNADPYIHSPDKLNISTNDFKYVIVRMRNQTSSNTAELFWATNASPSMDGVKHVTFPIVSNDAKQRYYIIDLSANANWTGTIKQLRLDPTIASSGTVAIDFIKFVGAYPATVFSNSEVIELENFNKGGQNNAYYDNDPSNQGTKYRTNERVDIESASDGGYNLGWMESGEWTEYLVKINTSTNYKLSLKAASVTTGNKIRFEINGEPLGTSITINNTGGLQTYNSFDQTVTLNAGLQVIRMYVEQSNGGLNSTSFTLTEQQNPNNSPSTPLSNANWVATDALGRTIPDYNNTGASRTGKYVGVFYYLWLGTHGNKVNDITKILKQYPTDPLSASNPGWGGQGSFHFWGEPEMGYYRSEDPWVVRRNMIMMANAGVDFLYFDATNAFNYLNVVDTVCRIITELRAQGIPAPYICFTTNSSSGKTMNALYDNFYSLNKYKDTWFVWEGKPLILGDINDVVLRSDVKNFFTIRKSWVGSGNSAQMENHWPWLNWTPQSWGWTGNPTYKEQVAVSVAFHPENPRGQSWTTTTNQPSSNQDYVNQHTGKGLHVQEQWNKALELDPKVIMVTQWNEWIAQRFIWNKGDGTYGGRPIKNGDSYFVDVFSEEFNRDMEPMKGGHTDNMYYQLVSNIRKYKGMDAPQTASVAKTITIDGTFSEWTSVSPVFIDAQGDTKNRNFPSYDPNIKLINITGRNDVIESRTTIDASNVYFYVKTAANITPYTDPNWMMVYINSDASKTTGWEGFDYVLNMGVTSASQTTLKKRVGSSWTIVGAATYKVVGNQIEIAVPRSLLGYTASDVSYYYQIFDNPQTLDNIEDNFVNGESAPDRRFNYSYANTKAYASPISITPYTQINGGTWTQTNTSKMCEGGTVSFGPHPNVETGWMWTGPNNFTANTRQINFTSITANKAGNYIATYTDVNGNKGTQIFTIIVNALPTATIATTSPTTFCEGLNVELTASNATSYKWYKGATVLTTTTGTLTANASGSYTVEVTNANGCKATSAATFVTVNPLPIVTALSNTPCIGSDLQLQATGGVSYAWNKSTVWTSALQNPTRTNVTSGIAGTYRVVVTDANNCVNQKSITVTINTLPTATISTTAPTTFCEGSNVELTASNATSYKWYKGATVLTTTTGTLTANASGSYTVEVTNANGCKATSAAKVVTVNGLPTATISTTSPTTFCEGSNVELTASNATSYKWYNGATVLTTTTGTLTANASGSYTVEVTNANGCKATSAAKVVAVNALPSITPNLYFNNTWLTISSATYIVDQPVEFGPWPLVETGWIWTGPNAYLSNVRAPKISNIQLNQKGIYTAKYTDNNGCSSVQHFNIEVTTVTGIDKIEPSNLISVYPNPTNNELNIQLNSTADIQTVYLLNATGEIVLSQKIESIHFTLDVRNLSSGMYILKVGNNLHKVIINL